MKYVFPAISTPEEKGYSVTFPDLEGCYTCGDDLSDAIYMAEDVCCLMLYDLETKGMQIPTPSDIKKVRKKKDEFVSLIRCDTDYYKRFYKSKSVKKTLSIPEWLNITATEAGLNFSQILQDALKSHLGL